MPVTTVDVQELATRLDELLALARGGTEVIVMEGNLPRAKLIPVSAGGPRQEGLHSGAIQTTADFDAPLAEEFWLGAS